MRGVVVLLVLVLGLSIARAEESKTCQSVLTSKISLDEQIGNPILARFLKNFRQELAILSQKGLLNRADVGPENMFIGESSFSRAPFFIVKVRHEFLYFSQKPGDLGDGNSQRWGFLEAAGPGRFTCLVPQDIVLHTGQVLRLIPGIAPVLIAKRHVGEDGVAALLGTEGLNPAQLKFYKRFKTEIYKILSTTVYDSGGRPVVVGKDDFVAAQIMAVKTKKKKTQADLFVVVVRGEYFYFTDKPEKYPFTQGRRVGQVMESKMGYHQGMPAEFLLDNGETLAMVNGKLTHFQDPEAIWQNLRGELEQLLPRLGDEWKEFYEEFNEEFRQLALSIGESASDFSSLHLEKGWITYGNQRVDGFLLKVKGTYYVFSSEAETLGDGRNLRWREFEDLVSKGRSGAQFLLDSGDLALHLKRGTGFTSDLVPSWIEVSESPEIYLSPPNIKE